MKGFFTLGVCVLMLTSLYAGDLEEKWYQGSVVLNNQQVVVGEISVYPAYHLIMLRTKEGVTALPAGKIESFFFYDEAVNINRKFVSRTEQESLFSQHQLYEVVLAGTIPVLRKQVALSRGTDDVHDFNYFLLYENELIELRKFKRLVYPKICEHSKELLTFVKKSNLDPSQPGTAIKIIRHYNLYSIQETLAMR